jgi:hypothetical protein
MAASGQEFHDDLSSVVPRRCGACASVSGQSLAADGPRWVEWWVANRDKFEARRAALTIRPEEVASTLIRFEASPASPKRSRSSGPSSRRPRRRA